MASESKVRENGAVIDLISLSSAELDVLSRDAGKGFEELPPERIPAIIIIQALTKGRTDAQSPMFNAPVGHLFDMATEKVSAHLEILPYMLTRRWISRVQTAAKRWKVVSVADTRPKDARWIEGEGLQDRQGHSISADYSLHCLLIQGGESHGPRVIRLGKGQGRVGRELAERLATPIKTKERPNGMQLPLFCWLVRVESQHVKGDEFEWESFKFTPSKSPLAPLVPLYAIGQKAYESMKAQETHRQADEPELIGASNDEDIPF